MNIERLILHNFRSIADITLHLHDYSVLVGENNAGKTTLMTALRMFYEDGGIKYDPDTDFPKFQTNDNESWIELYFNTTPSEQHSLKEDYRSPDGILRVRRFFRSETEDLVRQNQSNIFAYENGSLSRNLFYGARNVSQAKLGSVVFIPEVTKTDDAFKLTGPSPFRQIVNFVMKKSVQKSKSFSNLRQAFDEFNAGFKDESSKDGFSVSSLVNDINKSIVQWGIRFGVDVNAVTADEIVKNLLSHYVEDIALGGQRVNLASYGQGLQRHLIFTLIHLSTKYTEPRSEERKEFAPDFSLLLFEEPEAFLHPNQQTRLNSSLRLLSDGKETQVLVSTHSPHFVSKNIDNLTSLVRLHKDGPRTCVYQIAPDQLQDLLSNNTGLFRRYTEILADPESPESLKANIRNNVLGSEIPGAIPSPEEEAIRYFLALNPDRAAMFFARHVIICEGPSEKAIIGCLLEEEWTDLQDRQICIVDALGKFSIHRFMAILSAFGITHCVIMDSDEDKNFHRIANEFICEHSTSLTSGIYAFEKNFEHFLGIEMRVRSDLKPLHVLSCYRNKVVLADRITELRLIVEGLLPDLSS